MDTKKTLWIAGAVAGVAAVGGILYYLSTRESEAEASDQSSGVELNYEQVVDKLKKEIEEKKNVEKMDNGELSHDFIANIFEVLTKYSTLVKMCENKSNFNERIEALKNEDHKKYEELRKSCDEEDNNRMKEMQNILFEGFGTTEQEFMTALQKNMMQPALNQRLQELQKK